MRSRRLAKLSVHQRCAWSTGLSRYVSRTSLREQRSCSSSFRVRSTREPSPLVLSPGARFCDSPLSALLAPSFSSLRFSSRCYASEKMLASSRRVSNSGLCSVKEHALRLSRSHRSIATAPYPTLRSVTRSLRSRPASASLVANPCGKMPAAVSASYRIVR